MQVIKINIFNVLEYALLMDENVKLDLGHQLNSTLFKATFNQIDVMDEFTHFFDPYQGNCYTFNQDITELAEEENIRHPLIQDNSGPTGGLNVILDIQTVMKGFYGVDQYEIYPGISKHHTTQHLIDDTLCKSKVIFWLSVR